MVKDIEQVVKQPDSLISIKTNATAAQAAKIMTDNHVGCLVVFDLDNKFAGILSERDMLRDVLTKAISPQKVLVSDIMTADAISCTLNTTMADVEQLMTNHNIRHLPIVENDIPIGMISSRDVMAYRLSSNKMMKIAAEQLAMLSTGLKSLDFEDVIELSVNEVPASFAAERAVLFFESKDQQSAMIYRNGCALAEENLLELLKTISKVNNSSFICDTICKHCRNTGGQAPALLIPIAIQDQSGRDNDNSDRHGFLCMCRLNTFSMNSQEMQLYKASLLREVLSVNLTNARLYQNYQKARKDSETDPLTKVGTRRVLEQVLKLEYARAVRYKRAFSAAIIDLDNFKKINDDGGHSAGDKALRKLAKIILETIRKTDVVARFGGDEFVLLMPETELHEATVLLERLRRYVRKISIPKIKSVTISCGVAELNWGPPVDTAEEILKRADAALYEAKSAGRNRVVTDKTHAKTA